MRLLQCRSELQRLAADQRGAVALEYVTILMVGLLVVSGLAAFGVALSRQHDRTLTVLQSEAP